MRSLVSLVLKSGPEFAQVAPGYFHVLRRDMVSIVDFPITFALAENDRIVDVLPSLDEDRLVAIDPETLNLGSRVAWICTVLLPRELA